MNCEVQYGYGKYMEVLLEVASEYERMSSELFRLAHALRICRDTTLITRCIAWVRNAEQTTQNLRGLAARTDWANASGVLWAVAEAMGIKIEEESRWLKITVPAILPKRNPGTTHSIWQGLCEAACFAFRPKIPWSALSGV